MVMEISQPDKMDSSNLKSEGGVKTMEIQLDTSGIYEDQTTGQQFSSARNLAAWTGLSEDWVRDNGFIHVTGRGSNGKPGAKLYSVTEVISAAEDKSEKPKVEKGAGTYLNPENGEQYAPADYLATLTGENRDWVTNNFPSIDAVSANGKPGTRLFKVSEVLTGHYGKMAKVEVGEESGYVVIDEKTGKKYATRFRIAKIAGKTGTNEIDPIVKRLELEPKEGLVNGAGRELYCVDDILTYLSYLESLPKVGEDGICMINNIEHTSISKLTEQTGRSFDWIRSKAEKNGIKPIKGRYSAGETELYPKNLLLEIISVDDDLPIVEQDNFLELDGEYWGTKTSISLRLGFKTVGPVKTYILNDKPEYKWARLKYGENGIQKVKVYRLSQFEEAFSPKNGEDFVDIDESGETMIDGVSYISATEAVKNIERSKPWLIQKATELKVDMLVRVNRKTRQKVTLFNLEQLDQLLSEEKERAQLPRVDRESKLALINGIRYSTKSNAAILLGVSEGKINRLIDRDREEISACKGRTAANHVENLYSLDDLERLIADSLINKEATDGDNFERFVADQDIQDCYKIFGSLSHSDILILFGKEEFRAVPSDQISRIIRESLGDTLLEGVPLSDIEKYKDIFKRIDDLDPDVQSRMAEYLIETVVKSGVIELYGKNHGRYEEPVEFKDEIFAYLDDLSGKADSKFLSEALTKFKQEFAQMVSFERPGNMVESVSGNRHFPDFYQLINVNEIADKHRMLIADQMGMGKSASAILSKESLTEQNKCGTALVVVPSNILESETWQNYLSDKIDEDGKQVGYFKKGEAPKVLIVTNPSDLNSPNVTKDYDYVLISQERLNSNYMPGLMELDFDMLISDEVHKLKKPNGVLSKNLLRLGEKFTDEDKYMVLLSGTPIPNKVRDIAVSMKLLRSDVPDIKEATISQLSSQIIEGSVDVVGMSEIRGYLMSHMQMKRMTKEIVGHKAEEEDSPANLSKAEQELFELIREDDELTSSQKIQLMQQLTLNPQLIDPEFSGKGSKAAQLEKRLEKRFDEGAKKIVVFVNQYVSGVIRDGESNGSEFMSRDVKTIIDQLKLKDSFGAEILTIHGDVSGQERKDAQEKINFGNEKTIVLVGGQTADVGIDFSGASGVIFYNRPWSNYDKSQQAGRVYRPGLKHDIFIDTLTTGPFERGMAEYVDSKERVIEKMLKGIPLSELERDLIKTDEVRVSDDVDLSDISLGEIRHLDEYQSAPQRLNPYLAAAKRIGSEEKFREVFEGTEHGEEYARLYALCSDKGYQPNNNRLVANLIQEEIKETGKKPAQVAVLDLASGPRMLRRYSPEGLKTQVVSEDILRGHFLEEDIGKNAFVGSFKETKWPAHTFEFVTLLEAFHQTGYVPGKGNFERVEVLGEINRVLELGGKAYINILYSMGLKDKEGFARAISELGFKVVESQTGQYSSGKNFETTLIVLEKTKDLPAINLGVQEKPKARPDTATLIKTLKEKGLTEGLKLEVSKKYLGDTNVIMDTVEMPGGRKMKLNLTENDQRIKAIREKLQSDAEKLTIGHHRIESIPKDELERSHFKRCILGGKYVLYHKMPGDSGFFIYRQ